MAQNLFYLIIVVIVIVFLVRRLLKMNASGHAEADTSAVEEQAKADEKEAEIKQESARLARETKSATKEAVETSKEAVETGTETVKSKAAEAKAEVKDTAKKKAAVAKKEVAKKTPAKKASAKQGPTKDVDPVIDSANKSQPSPIGSELPDEISQPVAELERTKEPLARHRLYQQITENSYKHRNDAGWRQISKTYSEQHIAEFSEMVKPLKKANGGSLPQVLTFQNYATLLAEDGHYSEAIAVCEKALEFGLDDKTKTGFSGRIERIQKQQAKAEK